jgi:hypothetical protein
MQMHMHVAAAPAIPAPRAHPSVLLPPGSLTLVWSLPAYSSTLVLPCAPLQPFHGDKELIESDDVLLVPATAVQGRVRVLGLDAFQDLKRVGALDYFARLAFKVGPPFWTGLQLFAASYQTSR